MSYYSLSFDASVRHRPEPVPIIRVDPADGVAPRRAVDVLRAGGLLVFPTAAGYMVGCSALDQVATGRLCAATGASPDALQRFATSREQADRVAGPAQISRDPVPLALMRDADTPIAATPCRPGAPPAPTAQHVVFVLGDRLDLVLDAGPAHRWHAVVMR